MLYKPEAQVEGAVVKKCISPGQAENMHREKREFQQDPLGESMCYKSGLFFARACGFDFRRLVDGMVQRGRDVCVFAPLRPPYQESLPQLRVRAHGAEAEAS